jgi:phosphomannomutase
VQKHEQTKKALNKAIKLANLLLEEITNQSESKKSDLMAKVQSAGTYKCRLEDQENNTPTQNYALSLLSPTPVTEL